jgi:hypothetical protein
MLISVLLDPIVQWEQIHLNHVPREHLATSQCYLLNSNVLRALLDIFVVVLHLPSHMAYARRDTSVLLDHLMLSVNHVHQDIIVHQVQQIQPLVLKVHSRPWNISPMSQNAKNVLVGCFAIPLLLLSQVDLVEKGFIVQWVHLSILLQTFSVPLGMCALKQAHFLSYVLLAGLQTPPMSTTVQFVLLDSIAHQS